MRVTISGLKIDLTRAHVYEALRARQPKAVGHARWWVEVRRPGRQPAWGAWWPANEALRLVVEPLLKEGERIDWTEQPSKVATSIFRRLDFPVERTTGGPPPERLTRGEPKPAEPQRDSEPDHPNVTTKERPR